MVKVFSGTGKEAIEQAIAEAERQTSAELVVVIAPASDAYQSHFMLYGLIAGSAITMGLWTAKLITAFPVLLTIQLVCMALLAFVPWLRHIFLPLVPKRTRCHRAAHQAYEEYLIVSQHVSAATPVVLLYISVAEHYAHIVASRLVREKIPDERWNAVIDELAAAIPSAGIQKACVNAVQHMTKLLSPVFREEG